MTKSSTSWRPSMGQCSLRARSGWPGSSCASAAEARRSAWPIGLKRDLSAGCFRPSASSSRRPECPRPFSGGHETTVRERFGNTVGSLSLTRTRYRFDYAFPPEGVVDFFRENYGPNRAFGTLPQADQTSLRTALVDLWSGANQSPETGRTIVDAEYLEVLATRA